MQKSELRSVQNEEGRIGWARGLELTTRAV